MFKSIEDTVFNIEDIEVLLAVDYDDNQFSDILKIDTKIKFSVHRRDRSKHFSRDYYNWLAGFCSGDAIQAFNDDAFYETKGWDKILSLRLDGRKLWFADIYDSTRTNHVGYQPCFPMISRGAYEALGFLLHPQIRIYPADKKIYQVYKQAGLVVDCLDIKIGHDRDASNKEAWGEICHEDDVAGRLSIDLEGDVRKLDEANRDDNFASV